QKVLHDVVAKADAVLDNYNIDIVERIGLDYDDLRKVKPDIINLRMPNLSTTEPKRHFSTIGVNITAFTGLTYLLNHSGLTHQPIVNASPSAAPHDCYPCKEEDRWCVIAAENEQQWVALARVLGSEVVNDARFKTLNDRLRHREELNATITRWTQDKDAFEIM